VRHLGRQAALPGFDLSVWLHRCAENTVYDGLRDPKRPGNGCRFHPCSERRANEVFFCFGYLFDSPGLVTDGRGLWRRAGSLCHNGLILRTAPLATIDLGGDCLEQPLNLCIVQILERPRQIAWKRHRGRRGNPHSPNRRRQSPGRSRVLSLVFEGMAEDANVVLSDSVTPNLIRAYRPARIRSWLGGFIQSEGSQRRTLGGG
jgi:hypothetical protein